MANDQEMEKLASGPASKAAVFVDGKAVPENYFDAYLRMRAEHALSQYGSELQDGARSALTDLRDNGVEAYRRLKPVGEDWSQSEAFRDAKLDDSAWEVIAASAELSNYAKTTLDPALPIQMARLEARRTLADTSLGERTTCRIEELPGESVPVFTPVSAGRQEDAPTKDPSACR